MPIIGGRKIPREALKLSSEDAEWTIFKGTVILRGFVRMFVYSDN